MSDEFKKAAAGSVSSGRAPDEQDCRQGSALSGAAPQVGGSAREHVASADCWCEPELDTVDPETGAAVYVHRRPQ